MNLTDKIFLIAGVISLLFISCNDDEFGPRKESTPVIESSAVTPLNFTFGDSITLTAKITDPKTSLSALAYEVVSGGRVITSGETPINGDAHEVSLPVFVPLLSNQADNADVQVNLVARNILKGVTSTQITGLTGNRPVYNQLYMVTDKGAIVVLEPQDTDKNKYMAEGLTINTSFRFRVAEKLNDDNSIDYSGDVYGNVDGRIAMIREAGETAFAYAPESDYIKEVVFDHYGFTATTTGSKLTDEDLILSVFSEQVIDGESFRVLQLELQKGKTYSLFDELTDPQNLYNPDFFERNADDRITFLGETGEYMLYYNPVRKNIFVGVNNPSYPDYLLACGWGLGYPTHITTAQIGAVYNNHKRTHTDWGFDHVMKYVLLRQIEDGVYQGTFYTPGDHDHFASFKLFENTGWGNEKKAGEFTFTGENIISGDDNWNIPNEEDDPVIESANYRFTVNMNNKTVHIEKVTL